VALAITVTASGVTNRDSKQYFVDAEGCITMELIGSIKCDQLSLTQLQQKITAAYKEFYVDPSVTATFIYQPGQNMVSPWGTITVLGEVRRPGPVDMPPTEEIQLTRALMIAGGVTSMADKRRVKVTRCMADGAQKKTIVDLVEIGQDGRPEKDMVLKAGDVVWVPTAWY
jgi:protein involved in polysaccharide export with SLBB domain